MTRQVCLTEASEDDYCMMLKDLQSNKGNFQPIDPTGLLPIDDEDCPDVGGEGGDQDGQVGDGEREGDAVHDDRLLAHQPEA